MTKQNTLVQTIALAEHAAQVARSAWQDTVRLDHAPRRQALWEAAQSTLAAAMELAVEAWGTGLTSHDEYKKFARQLGSNRAQLDQAYEALIRALSIDLENVS